MDKHTKLIRFVVFTNDQFEGSVMRRLTIFKMVATYTEIPSIFTHCNDRKMNAMASRITGQVITCLAACGPT